MFGVQKSLSLTRCFLFIFSVFGTLGFLLMDTSSARADWDYQAGFSARTVPFGGSFSGTLGYGKLLWGSDPGPSLPIIGPPSGEIPNWKFGYIRPSLTLQTIGFTSRSLLELDLFPISIVGITLGQSFHYRLDRASQFDCSLVNCNGYLSRTYVRAQAIVGVGQTAVMAWAQYASVGALGSLPILEETWALVSAPSSDSLATLTVTAMYRLQDDWVLGLLGSQGRFITSGNHSFTSLGYANYFTGRWGFFLGAGTYSSSHQDLSPTVYGMIQFMGKRPMGWF